jgi:hypothetical protein
MMRRAIIKLVALLLLAIILMPEQFMVIKGAQRRRSAVRRVRAPAELVQQMARDAEMMKRCLEVDHHNDAKEFAARLYYQRADLNRDGYSDYLVNPGDACSQIGANNVPLFAYLWKSGEYRMVLEDGGLSIRAGRALSNGHLTIIIEAHASGNDVDVTHYRFSGERYKPFRCLTREYDDARQRFTRTVRRPCEE